MDANFANLREFISDQGGPWLWHRCRKQAGIMVIKTLLADTMIDARLDLMQLIIL
jgi:hypothetical protein